MRIAVMPQTRRCFAWLSILTSLSGLALITAGCGTGDYEQRLATRSTRMQNTMNFNELYAPQPLPGTTVAVRVPVLFKDSPLVEGVAGKDGKPVDSRRIKPGLIEVPWLKFTYEGFIDNPDGTKTPFYCYVAAVNKAAAGNLEADWKRQLASKGPAGEWSDFQSQTPEGQAVAWRMLQFNGPQEFCTIAQNGQEQYSQVPGTFDIYLHEEAGNYVLIAWRVPASIQQQVDPAKLAKMMTGCVSAK